MGCVTDADYIKLTYPYWVVWLLNRPMSDSLIDLTYMHTSFAHELRNLRLLQSHVKRHGQRIAYEGLTTILTYYNSYIDSLLHSLLSESIINSLNVT